MTKNKTRVSHSKAAAVALLLLLPVALEAVVPYEPDDATDPADGLDDAGPEVPDANVGVAKWADVGTDRPSGVDSTVGKEASLVTSLDAGSRKSSTLFKLALPAFTPAPFLPKGVEVDMDFTSRADGGIFGVVCISFDGGLLKSDPSGVLTTALVREFLTTALSVLPLRPTGVETPAVGSKCPMVPVDG